MIRGTLNIAGSLVLCASLGLTFGAAFGQDKAGDPDKGKTTFEQCAICHNVDNAEKKMGPSLQGLYKHKTLANGKPVNDANVLAQINNGGNGMPAYADMLSAEDKANIIAYLHTL
jgi:cytochrome c